jgi:hypothetical protein
LISITVAPFLSAIKGNSRAGETTAEVPITKKRSAQALAFIAAFIVAGSKGSPNWTTWGRNAVPPYKAEEEPVLSYDKMHIVRVDRIFYRLKEE